MFLLCHSDSVKEQNRNAQGNNETKNTRGLFCAVSNDMTFLFSPFYWHLTSYNQVLTQFLWTKSEAETWTFFDNEMNCYSSENQKQKTLNSTQDWIGFAWYFSNPLQLKTEKKTWTMRLKLTTSMPWPRQRWRYCCHVYQWTSETQEGGRELEEMYKRKMR